MIQKVDNCFGLYSSVAPKANLLSDEYTVRFNYDSNALAWQPNRAFLSVPDVFLNENASNTNGANKDQLFSQYSPSKEIIDDRDAAVPTEMFNTRTSIFPCAAIRCNAEIFRCHCRNYRYEDLLCFPAPDLSLTPAKPDSSSVKSLKFAPCICEDFAQKSRSPISSSKLSFSFNEMHPLASKQDSATNRKDLKLNHYVAKSRNANALGNTQESGSPVTVLAGFAAQFACLLCQNVSLLRDMDGLLMPFETKRIEASLKRVLSASASGLPEPISKLRDDSEFIHATLSSLKGTLQLTFFVLQALDKAMTHTLERKKGTQKKFEKPYPSPEAISKKVNKNQNAEATAHDVNVASLREFAHALWLHLLNVWPEQVVSLGYIEWWLAHPCNNVSDRKIEKHMNPRSHHLAEEKAKWFAPKPDVSSFVLEQVRQHTEDIFSTLISYIHSLASTETWSVVGDDKVTLDYSSRALLPQDMRGMEECYLFDYTKKNQHAHKRVGESFVDSKFPWAQHRKFEQTHYWGSCNSQSGIKPHSSTQFSSELSASSEYYSTPNSFQGFGNIASLHRKALFAHLIIRFLCSCFFKKNAFPRGNVNMLDQCEVERLSSLLLALCRMVNSIPARTVSHIERLPPFLPFSYSAAIITRGGVSIQTAAFLQTLLSVFSEAMMLAAKLVRCMRGVRLEMKTDLTHFVGRLLRLRDVLALRCLKSSDEFNTELEQLTTFLALTK